MEGDIVDEITIVHDSTAAASVGIRQAASDTWSVEIRANGIYGGHHSLSLPKSREHYHRVFRDYVHESARWNSGLLEDESADSSLISLRQSIEEYRESLASNCRLDNAPWLLSVLKAGSTMCRIVVHQKDPVLDSSKHHSGRSHSPSIHRIHWELLEHAILPASLGRGDKYHFEVCRVLSLKHLPKSLQAADPRQEHLRMLVQLPEPLEAVAEDPRKTFKILLVLARRLEPAQTQPIIMDEGAEAHLAQWPLMNIQRDLDRSQGSHRLMLDIVRPGSLAELQTHLKTRAAQEVRFHVVHFDLHGVDPKRCSQATDHQVGQLATDPDGLSTFDESLDPGLWFAHEGKSEWLEHTDAKDVARLMTRFQIENVVLNSCWSACARYGRKSNMCELLLKAGDKVGDNNRGVKSVLGMWGPANDQMIPEFLESFYKALLLGHQSFERAVATGRAALRSNPSRQRDGHCFAEDFMCVQYLRGPNLVMPAKKRPTRTLGATLRRLLFPHHRRTPESSLSVSPETSQPSVRGPAGLGSSLRGISPRRSPLQPRDPELIKLQITFLRLELLIMEKPLIYAKGRKSPTSRIFSRTEEEEEEETEMIRLGYLWQKTSFIRRMVVYSAASLKNPSERPRSSLDIPRTSSSTPPRKGSKVLYIIKNVDSWATRVGDETNKKAVKNGLLNFLDHLNWKDSYVVIPTKENKRGWDRLVKEQGWASKSMIGHWWSFDQDAPDVRFKRLRVPQV